MKPTIGRTVHFGEKPRAAIITAIHADGVVDLCVLNPTGMSFNQLVAHSDTPTAGHWNWPPREGVASGRIVADSRFAGGCASEVAVEIANKRAHEFIQSLPSMARG